MKILIISDAIAPQQGIGAIRWTKLAKYLKINHSSEAHIAVLTYKKNYEDDSRWRYAKDNLLEKDMCYFDEYIAVPVKIGLNITNLLKGRVIGSTNHFITSNETMKHSIKTQIKYRLRLVYEDYYNHLLSFYVWHRIKDVATAYDVVISTYNPIWPTMVAAKIKKKNTRIFWLCDFRDSCGRGNIDMSGYAPWHKKYAMRHCAYANAVTQVDQYIDTSTPSWLPHYMVCNGYDPMEFMEPMPPRHFDLVYTGSVYGLQQDFGVIFHVLNELIEQGKVDSDDVSVVYAGRNSGEVDAIAKANGGQDMLVNHGLLQRAEARMLQSKAAILIQASFNTDDDRDAWTGKMYEYMMAQKPIVYIINGSRPNSWVTGEIDKIGGVSYETIRHSEMYETLKEYILDKYVEWKETGDVSINRDDDYVAQYSYSNLSECVWSIIGNGGARLNELSV